MAKYNGPSYFNGENPRSFNPEVRKKSYNKDKEQDADKRSWIEEPNPFKNEHAKTLPDEVTRREDVEKGFREYLKEKRKALHNDQNKRTEHYIAPPFEASKVPSPIYGFKKPPLKKKDEWDYKNFREELQKEEYDFLLFEENETPELSKIWNNMLQDKQEKIKKEAEELPSASVKNMKRKTRLYRSLSGIIEEDQSGENYRKRNVPGFFSDE